jgi:hypothetical protein
MKLSTVGDNQPGHVTRRGVLIEAASLILCAPAIVRAANLMPVRGVIMPIKGLQSESASPTQLRPQEGFLRRLLFHWCDSDLKAGRKESSMIVNGGHLSEEEMRNLVAYARRFGFLK